MVPDNFFTLLFGCYKADSRLILCKYMLFYLFDVFTVALASIYLLANAYPRFIDCIVQQGDRVS
jgi:hypothetical protein